MKLSNSFTVGLPIATAWALLTDLERVAPSLPGAELTQVEGDEYRGLMRVRVGPILAQYSGRARFVTVDEPSHHAGLRAEGRDTNGQGNAAATMSIALRPDGERTAVEVETDLSISGRVAQFGRGVLGDVSTALLQQFVERLERDVAASAKRDAPGTDAPAAASAAAPVRASSTPPEAVDLLQLVARSSARRFAVAGAAAVASVVAVVVLRRALRRHRWGGSLHR